MIPIPPSRCYVSGRRVNILPPPRAAEGGVGVEVSDCTSFEEVMFTLVDHGFCSKKGNPANTKVCKRGSRNVRMLAETVLSMLTTVCHFKHVSHRVWEYFKARLAFTMAAFNLLA